MNFLCKILLVMMLCSYGFRATAQEAQLGTGLVCDTAQQAERFIHLFDKSAQDAIDLVNSEAGDPQACVVTMVLFIPGKQVTDVMRSHDRAFRVVELQVIGLHTPVGLRPVHPMTWYAVIKVDEVET